VQPGSNTARLSASSGGQVLVQRAELDYERAATLEKDASALVLEETLGDATEIAGLPQEGVAADLTSGDLLETRRTEKGAVVACPKGHKLAAFVPSRAREASTTECCLANDLRDKATGADWVAIGPRSILPALEPLAAHRASQGLKTKLVALEDVEDEFTDGAWGDESLKAFFAFSLENWKPRPRFFLLAGDAWRDARPSVEGAWVPTTLVDTFDNGGSASDRMMLPESARSGDAPVALGRFPVRTLDEAKSVVAKTIAYEKAPPHEGQKQLAFVCGEGRFGELVDGMIEQLFTQAVSKRVPESFDVDVTYGNPTSVFLYPPDQFSKRVVERLSQGPLVFDYVGHGAPWALDDVHVPLEKPTKKKPWPPEARFPILRTEDAAKVACEPGRNPIVLITACWTGCFDEPERSVGETLFLNPKGAVAVFAASRVSHPLANALLSLELTENLFALRDHTNAERPRLGERLARAQARLSPKCGGEEGKVVMGFAKMMLEGSEELAGRLCEDDKRLFNLLGDPALVPHEPKLALEVRTVGKVTPGSKIEVNVADEKGPVVPALVTLERLRGVPEGVEGLPSSTKGRALVEDAEVRERILATYKRANDPVVARGKVEDGRATLDLPGDLAPGKYVVKIYARGEESLVGSLRIEVLPPPPVQAKKWW
jgi:hypothetical protein